MIETPSVAWATIGLMLCIFELFVPGTYLLWFGLASFVVCFYTYFVDADITAQLITFAISSAIFVSLGLFVYQKIFKSTKVDTTYANLNNSIQQYVGMQVTLTEDVVDNRTKVKVGDTVWMASCEKELKKGDKAKVVEIKDNLILIIK